MKPVWKLIQAAIFIAIGIVIASFFMKGCGKDPIRPVVTPPAEVKKEVIQIDSSFQEKYDSAQHIIHNKERIIASQKKDLVTAQGRARQLENTVQALIDSIPQSNDFEGGNLKTEFSALVQNSRERDSLCNSTIKEQDSIIGLKSGQVYDAIAAQRSLMKVIDRRLEEQAVLENHIAKLERINKRKAAGSKIWKLAALIATVVAIAK